MELTERVKRSKAVFFDLFHTLFSFQSEGIQGKNTSEILGVPEPVFSDALFNSSDERLRGLDRDKYSIMRNLARRCGLDPSEDLVREAADYREARFRNGFLNASPERLAALHRLKAMDKRLGLISNADAVEVASWSDSPLAEPFDCIVFSFDVGWVKPEREIYEEGLKRLKVSAEESVFVGDGGSQELRGAREVGMTTVLTTEIAGKKWPERIDRLRRDADYEIESLMELVE